LSDYDFGIIHKPCKKHINADVLSRHIAAVQSVTETNPTTDDFDLTCETIGKEQRTDTYCQQQKEKVISGSEQNFCIKEDGILFHGNNCQDGQIVVPKTLVQTVVEHNHDKVFAGHQGITRTQDLIKLNYFWPTLNKDVEEYVSKCHSCAQHKSGRVVPAPLNELPETHSPFELTSIDICGPYPVSGKGNRYLSLLSLTILPGLSFS
jgi:hypothetical protein